MIRNVQTKIVVLLTLLLCEAVSAQRGLPPKESFRGTNVAKFTQLMDFLPELVALLEVPDGWEVSIAASGLGRVRMLENGPNGELYITRRDAGDVLMLKDVDGDNKFDDVKTVVYNFKSVHGINIKDGYLYLCSNNELRRYKLNTDGMVGEKETLINNLPDGGQHPNRTMHWGPDGKLYISVGTQCNDCKENDMEVAAMLQVDPTNWTRTVYATGLRNTIGFDWHPETNELWGLDNGCDAKGNNWPPEEVNRIVKDGNYGYPFCYGKRDIDESRDDPPGDTKDEWVKSTEPSVLDLQAHMAPIAFQFFDKTTANIPADYTGDGLVCWRGSWNRNKPVGYKVQRILFENGKPVGAEDFLTGFLKPGFPLFKRKMQFGRPTGLTITPQGAVYVSDDNNGVVYCVKRKVKA
ncbi:MAG TPA: PQQ-dependent sugar dehydrogenase [Flavobacterium sp.]|jgi:glucose/arabinose dehydrogenase